MPVVIIFGQLKLGEPSHTTSEAAPLSAASEKKPTRTSNNRKRGPRESAGAWSGADAPLSAHTSRKRRGD